MIQYYFGGVVCFHNFFIFRRVHELFFTLFKFRELGLVGLYYNHRIWSNEKENLLARWDYG